MIFKKFTFAGEPHADVWINPHHITTVFAFPARSPEPAGVAIQTKTGQFIVQGALDDVIATLTTPPPSSRRTNRPGWQPDAARPQSSQSC